MNRSERQAGGRRWPGRDAGILRFALAGFALLAWGLAGWTAAAGAAREQPKADAVAAAAQRMRSAITLSLANLQAIDQGVRNAKARAPAGAPLLDGIRRMALGKWRGHGSILSQFQALEADLSAGLKDFRPGPCGQGGLAAIPRTVAARKRLAQAVGRADTVAKDAAAYWKEADTELSKLSNRLRQGGDASLKAIEAFRAELRGNLGAVNTRVSDALDSKGEGLRPRVLALLKSTDVFSCIRLPALGLPAAKAAAQKPSAPAAKAALPKPAFQAAGRGGDAAVRRPEPASAAPAVKAALPKPAAAGSPEEDAGGEARPGGLAGWGAGLKDAARGLWDRLAGGKPKAEPPAPSLPAIDKLDCEKKFIVFETCKPKDGVKYAPVDGALFVKDKADPSDVAPSDVTQGELGDCYYLAALAAIAEKNPGVIRDMIKDNGDGTYSVKFQRPRKWWELWKPEFTEQTIKVDNQLPMRNGSRVFADFGDTAGGKPELWTMLGEKAYAAYLGSYNALNKGGYPGDAMAQITGVKSKTYGAGGMTVDRLADMDSRGYAMAIGTKANFNDPLYSEQKLVPSHAYWIESVDTRNKTVTLANPWGWQTQRVTLTEAEFQRALGSVYVNPIHE